MAKPVLLVTRRLPPDVEARAAAEFDARLSTSDLPMPDVLAQVSGADAILTCPGDNFDAALITALPPSVKVIATFSVGFDHIDVAAASARAIAVCNTPDVLSVTTAETALLLILAAARRAGEGERLVRAGRWQGWAPTQLLGVGVVGRRLGIFGMGRIGRELARMARGIGMTIHYRDVARLSPALEDDAIFHDDDASFLGACDVLSLNAPGGGETYHWLNAERIALLRRGGGECRTRHAGGRCSAHRGVAERSSRFCGSRRVRWRAEAEPRLSRIGERCAAAAPRQRHGGDARLNGVSRT